MAITGTDTGPSKYDASISHRLGDLADVVDDVANGLRAFSLLVFELMPNASSRSIMISAMSRLSARIGDHVGVLVDSVGFLREALGDDLDDLTLISLKFLGVHGCTRCGDRADERDRCAVNLPCLRHEEITGSEWTGTMFLTRSGAV